MSDSQRTWGGRFTEETDAFVARLNASVAYDQRLYAEDIDGSKAHAEMLAKQGVITTADLDAIKTGLETIRDEIESGQFEWKTELEDVHMNIESRLIELIGNPGAKLHTARSRNDQVATDLKLWLRRHITQLCTAIDRMQMRCCLFVNVTVTPYCRVTPICSVLSRSRLATTCSHILKCLNATVVALWIALNALMNHRSAPQPSRARHSNWTANIRRPTRVQATHAQQSRWRRRP